MENLGKVVGELTRSRKHLIESMRSLEEKVAEVTKYARRLLGCFRTGDANNPEIYTSGVVAILAGYPLEIVRMVCDPCSGIPSKCNWLPTMAEIKSECERLHAATVRREEREASICQQLEERAEAESERQSRPTYDELKAKYGQTWGLNPRPEQKTHDEAADRQTIERNKRWIENEYTAHGEEPLRSGELVVSRSLAQSKIVKQGVG